MKTKSLLLATIICCLSFVSQAEKYVGGDISELPTMEGAKAKYFDKNGKPISDLITYSKDQGMNAMRVRLFVDPDTYISTQPDADPYACQSYEYILPICKRIKAAGMKLLLDFHYSDSWADPVKQWTPAEWSSLSDTELYDKIYEYTKDVLTNLNNEGVVPDFIQTGNEISYGMCWGAKGTKNPRKAYANSANSNLTRFHKLLEKAIEACREVCPNSKIVLHTERVASTGYLTSFYDWANDLDYDIIGTSYYSYYHGKVSQLDDALKALENKKYGKDIWVVETGAAINWAIGDSDKQFYELTDAGQNQFAQDLLAVLDKHPSVNGLFWWEMDYNAYGTSLKNWYNASLFDTKTGKATSAFYTIAGWSGYEAPPIEGDDTETTGQDYYLLYNQGGDWTYPGAKFNNDGKGIYTLTDIEIYQTDQENGWFAITSSNGSSWGEVEGYLFGPASDSEKILTIPGKSSVSAYTDSWQVAAGSYDLTFNANSMELSIKEAGAEDPSDGDDNEEEVTPPGGDDQEEEVTPPVEDEDKEEEVTPPAQDEDKEEDVTPPAQDEDKEEDVTPPAQGGDKEEDVTPPAQDGGSGDNVGNPSDGDKEDEETSKPGEGETEQPGNGETEQPGNGGNGQPGEGNGDQETEEPGEDSKPGDEVPGDSDTENPDDGNGGVDEIYADQEVQYFTLNGVKVTYPQKGLYIRVANGKSQKILIK